MVKPTTYTYTEGQIEQIKKMLQEIQDIGKGLSNDHEARVVMENTIWIWRMLKTAIEGGI